MRPGDSTWAALALLSIVAACSAPVLEPGRHATMEVGTGLQFSVSQAPRAPDDSLSWVGQVYNPTDRAIRLEFSACALAVHAFTEGRPTPVWVSEGRRPYRSNATYMCFLYLAGVDLAPGQTETPHEFHLGVPVVEVLGDSLPDGPYRFEAWLELKGAQVGPFRLGSATLQRGTPDEASIPGR